MLWTIFNDCKDGNEHHPSSELIGDRCAEQLAREAHDRHARQIEADRPELFGQPLRRKPVLHRQNPRLGQIIPRLADEPAADGDAGAPAGRASSAPLLGGAVLAPQPAVAPSG